RGRRLCEARRDTPRIARNLHRLLLVDAVRFVLQEAVVPARRELEHMRKVGTGEARRWVSEVADVKTFWPCEPAVRVDGLIDVECEVATALEEEARRGHRGHQAQARPCAEEVAHGGEVLGSVQLRRIGRQSGLYALVPAAL